MRDTFLSVMTKRILMCGGLIAVSTLLVQARNLEMYWTDSEGGASTLIVAPSGQSLLIDAGFATDDDRDARRIAAIAKTVGIGKIDLMLTTHYHLDHVGGTPALAKLLPIERFYDHGESIEANTPDGKALFEAYEKVARGKRVTVKPGDKIPLDGLDITVVSSNGDVIGTPINGGGPNDLCTGAEKKPLDTTENLRSIGVLLTFGSFTFLSLGDLTWNGELALACPENKVGHVTLFQATHHGFANGKSGAPALVWAAKPQVVIVNNSPRKGFDAAAYETLAQIPSIQGIWQLHRTIASDEKHNASESMIANLAEGDSDRGEGLKVLVSRDGQFIVTNLRNQFSKTYAVRH
jgi:competence protein ComEC